MCNVSSRLRGLLPIGGCFFCAELHAVGLGVVIAVHSPSLWLPGRFSRG